MRWYDELLLNVDNLNKRDESMFKKALFFTMAMVMVPGICLADSVREIGLAGVRAVFIDRDVAAIDKLFAQDYIQHNPLFPNGNGVLKGFAQNMPDGFRYEIGNVIADEKTGMVAIHFRSSGGFGPKPRIGVDIFRVEKGKIVEHWDVLQEEVIETKSGNPMWTPSVD